MGRFYKIDTQGKHWLQRLASAPVWTAADEGRIIYDEAAEELVYGNASEWKSATGEYVDVPLHTILLVDSDTVLDGYQLQTDIDDRVIYVSKGSGGANGVGGNNFGTWTQPVHTHTQPTHTHTLGSHTHTLGSHTHAAGLHTHTAGSHVHPVGSHTHSLQHTGDTVNVPYQIAGSATSPVAISIGAGSKIEGITEAQPGTVPRLFQTINAVTTGGSGNTDPSPGSTGTGSGATGGPSAASDGPTGGSDPSGADVTGTPSVTQENSFKGTWRPNGRNFTRQKRV